VTTLQAFSQPAVAESTLAGIVDVMQSELNDTYQPATLSHPDRRGSLIKRIPKVARPACASLLVEVSEAVLKAPSLAKNWSDLLNFGKFFLSKPTRGGCKRNLGKIIQDRVAAWRSSDRNYTASHMQPTPSIRYFNTAMIQ